MLNNEFERVRTRDEVFKNRVINRIYNTETDKYWDCLHKTLTTDCSGTDQAYLEGFCDARNEIAEKIGNLEIHDENETNFEHFKNEVWEILAPDFESDEEAQRMLPSEYHGIERHDRNVYIHGRLSVVNGFPFRCAKNCAVCDFCYDNCNEFDTMRWLINKHNHTLEIDLQKPYAPEFPENDVEIGTVLMFKNPDSKKWEKGYYAGMQSVKKLGVDVMVEYPTCTTDDIPDPFIITGKVYIIWNMKKETK